MDYHGGVYRKDYGSQAEVDRYAKMYKYLVWTDEDVAHHLVAPNWEAAVRIAMDNWRVHTITRTDEEIWYKRCNHAT